MRIVDKPWDSEVLGLKCGVVAEGVDDPSDTNYDFLLARVPSDEAERIQALEDAGFRIAEVYVQLERDLIQHPARRARYMHRKATEDDAEAIGELASRLFIHDRLSNDPRISRKLASDYKRQWGLNACFGYADATFVYESRGQIVGFVALKDNVLYLIGVEEKYRGYGIGKSLVERACAWVPNDCIITGTQGGNVPALMMYQACHFDVVKLSVGMHWLRNGFLFEQK